MKALKIAALLAIMALSLGILAVPASAGHEPGHDVPAGCENDTPGGGKNKHCNGEAGDDDVDPAEAACTAIGGSYDAGAGTCTVETEEAETVDGKGNSVVLVEYDLTTEYEMYDADDDEWGDATATSANHCLNNPGRDCFTNKGLAKALAKNTMRNYGH